MGYISIATWRDLTNGHLYHEGEKFPFDGGRVTKDRLEELESGRNQAGLKLIRADDAKTEPEKARNEGTPVEPEKAQETAEVTAQEESVEAEAAEPEKPGAEKPTKSRRAKGK